MKSPQIMYIKHKGLSYRHGSEILWVMSTTQFLNIRAFRALEQSKHLLKMDCTQKHQNQDEENDESSEPFLYDLKKVLQDIKNSIPQNYTEYVKFIRK